MVPLFVSIDSKDFALLKIWHPKLKIDDFYFVFFFLNTCLAISTGWSVIKKKMKLANTENEIGSWLDNEDNFSSVERFFWPIRELFLYFWNTPINFYVNDLICSHKKGFLKLIKIYFCNQFTISNQRNPNQKWLWIRTDSEWQILRSVAFQALNFSSPAISSINFEFEFSIWVIWSRKIVQNFENQKISSVHRAFKIIQMVSSIDLLRKFHSKPSIFWAKPSLFQAW